MDRPWTRPGILAEMVLIIMETRGVTEEEVVPTATLYEDLGLESIDFLELASRMQERWQVSFPTDDYGSLIDDLSADSTPEDRARGLLTVREVFFIDFPDETPGIEPFDANELYDQLERRLTVDMLVNWVATHLKVD